MNWATDQIQTMRDSGRTFNIFTVPRATVVCEGILEQEKLSGRTYSTFLESCAP